MDNYKIYALKLKYEEEIRYVGRTKDRLSIRLSKHKTNARISKEKNINNHRVNWVNRYSDQIEIICIEENILTKEESCIKEIEYISSYKKLYDLVNTTIGGDGGCEGYKHTEDARKKISEGGLGKKKPGVSYYMTNRIISDETKNKMIESLKIAMKGEKNPMFGKKRQDIIEKNIERAGFKMSDATKNEMSVNRTGEKNAHAKLNTIQVLEIRENINNYTTKELSNIYGVSTNCINGIKCRRTWKSI